VEKNGEND